MNEWHQLVSSLAPLLLVYMLVSASSFNSVSSHSRLCWVHLSPNYLSTFGTVLSIMWFYTDQNQVCRHRVLSKILCYVVRNWFTLEHNELKRTTFLVSVLLCIVYSFSCHPGCQCYYPVKWRSLSLLYIRWGPFSCPYVHLGPLVKRWRPVHWSFPASVGGCGILIDLDSSFYSWKSLISQLFILNVMCGHAVESHSLVCMQRIDIDADYELNLWLL